MSQDELEQKKKLYDSEPDRWVVYAKWKHKSKLLYKQQVANPFEREHLKNATSIYIIDIKDEAIADKVIANPDVEVEFTWVDDKFNGATLEKAIDFFKHYDNNKWSYQLAESKCDDIKQICDNPDVNALNKEPFVVTEVKNEFADRVYAITNGLAEMLISKNKKYGNSALEPKRIFSKASAVEQILVRIDDKLSRMSNQSDTEDEDVVEDLLGYFVLLKIAKKETK